MMTPGERAELDALRYRIELLEDALGMRYEPPIGWGLTVFEAKIVGILIKHPISSRARIATALYAERDDPPDDGVVDVFISRARKKLAPAGIKINNTWGVGYWLDPAVRAALNA